MLWILLQDQSKVTSPSEFLLHRGFCNAGTLTKEHQTLPIYWARNTIEITSEVTLKYENTPLSPPKHYFDLKPSSNELSSLKINHQSQVIFLNLQIWYEEVSFSLLK